MNDTLFFVVIPYLALALFFLGTIARYRKHPFTVSSLSTQFLENRQHFWSTVPFHYGILGVLAIHFAGLVIPDAVLWWNRVPARLFVLEISGLALALMALFGLGSVMLRRFWHAKARRVTNLADWILYVLLAVQIVLGIMISVMYGWGSSWFSGAAAPWLWSVFTLHPETARVAALPLVIKMHIVNAWLIVGFFPFTRLVHILVVPNPYLWRKPQVVLWNRDRRSVRQP